MLEALFGATITRFAGDDGLELVERVRGLARSMREGSAEAGAALKALLAELDEAQLKVVIRSFSIFLELANLAEDRQGVAAEPEATVAAALEKLRALNAPGMADRR